MKKLLWLPLAAAALTAGTAAAQHPIVPGEITRGTLSVSDPRLENNGPHYDEYAFEARRGETVILQMESRDFDAYLRLGTVRRGGGFRQLAYDDDGGNGRNSRLEYRVPDDGTYVVRASSLSRSTGAYTLTLSGGRVAGGSGGYDPDPIEPVRPRPRPRPRNDRRDGLVQAGERIDGYLSPSDPRLDGGEPFHLYRYQGRAGERVSITLRSDDFDSYLVLGTPGGRHGVGSVLDRDDDGGGNRDSHIEFALPDDRVYVIRVNPLGSGEGEYTLDVESDLQGGYSGRPRPDDYDRDRDDQDYGYGTVDNRLIGRWGLVSARTRVDGRRWSQVAANAGYGYLEVRPDGTYTWERDGRTRRGQLEMFAPRNEVPGTPYYRIRDGREDYYVFYTESRGERFMQVNSATTDLVLARGYLDPNSR